jgi:hypothetical protein
MTSSAKISLVGTQESINSIFFLKNNSIFARKQGDFIAGYESKQNTVYGVNGPSFNNHANSSFNTAIGYQSFYNTTTRMQANNIAVGNGASYDVICNDSIVIGSKTVRQTTTEKSFTNVITVGNSSGIGSSSDSIYIGNNIVSNSVVGNNNTSKNVAVVGANNIVQSSDSIILGFENSNSAASSIIIGSSVNNTGTNSLLIFPKDEDGNSVDYSNSKDNYVNIFGIITGSNNKLNINQAIEFADLVDFKSSLFIQESINVSSNVNIGSNLSVTNSLYSASNNTIFLNVASNAVVGGDVSVSSNIYGSNIFASNIDVGDNIRTGSISVADNIFINDIDLSLILRDLNDTDAQNVFNINENLSLVTTLSNDLSNASSNLEYQINQLSNDIIQIISSSPGGGTSLNPDINNLVYSNYEDIVELKTKTNDLEFAYIDQINAQFDAIIRNDRGQYTINVVRGDSLANFPAFDGDYRSIDGTTFDPPSQPNIGVTLIYPERLWEDTLDYVADFNLTDVIGLRTPGAILYDSNVFNAKSFFKDEAAFSNNVSFASNVFIAGAIKSFGSYVTINDSLLIHDALHVGDFIETNAIKVDYSFNNFVKVFSNITFSNDWMIYKDESELSNLVFNGTNPESLIKFNNGVVFDDTVNCNSNIAFSNDWSIFTRENTNDPLLKDLVFKGTIPGSLGVETSFTDFIPGALNFTGQHRCTYDGTGTDSHAGTGTDAHAGAGFIVSSTGIYSDLDDQERIHIDDAIPIVRLSQKAYDKTVFGVISAYEDVIFPDADNRRCFQIGALQFKTNKVKRSKKLIINSVGEGGLWVCRQNGDIFNGDLIVSSDKPGYGMRQHDDIIKNYTVAKATCDAVFYDGEQLFIGCIYKM